MEACMGEITTIPALEARVHLGDIMKRAFSKHECFVVEKSGIPMVAILNADEYFRIIEERRERFKILDQIKARIPEFPAAEIEKDVEEAVRAVRKAHAQGGS
jgi:hypothetical protein